MNGLIIVLSLNKNSRVASIIDLESYFKTRYQVKLFRSIIRNLRLLLIKLSIIITLLYMQGVPVQFRPAI